MVISREQFENHEIPIKETSATYCVLKFLKDNNDKAFTLKEIQEGVKKDIVIENYKNMAPMLWRYINNKIILHRRPYYMWNKEVKGFIIQ